jgi:hypothetical protein
VAAKKKATKRRTSRLTKVKELAIPSRANARLKAIQWLIRGEKKTRPKPKEKEKSKAKEKPIRGRLPRKPQPVSRSDARANAWKTIQRLAKQNKPKPIPKQRPKPKPKPKPKAKALPRPKEKPKPKRGFRKGYPDAWDRLPLRKPKKKRKHAHKPGRKQRPTPFVVPPVPEKIEDVWAGLGKKPSRQLMLYYAGWIRNDETLARNYSSLRAEEEAMQKRLRKRLDRAHADGEEALLGTAYRISDEFQIPVGEVFTFFMSP